MNLVHIILLIVALGLGFSAHKGAGIDPNGGGAMDPNGGRSTSVRSDDGVGIDPDGRRAAATAGCRGDYTGCVDPNG